MKANITTTNIVLPTIIAFLIISHRIEKPLEAVIITTQHPFIFWQWTLTVAKIRMLRWMIGPSRNDKIRNGRIRGDIGVASLV